MRIFLVLFLAFLAGCASTPEIPPKAPIEPIEGIETKGPKVSLSWERPNKPERLAWSETTMEEVRKNFKQLDSATDKTKWCPGYNQLTQTEKENFWGELVVDMVYFESSYNPKSSYFESDASLRIYSIGLFQLSYEDKKRYPFCDLRKEAKTLEDPINNLRCGIGILATLIERDALIASGSTSDTAKGAARYWSVMRPLYKGKPRDSYNRIKGMLNKLTYCKI